MLKTRKAAAKRFKITKKKKILRRYSTQDHFLARRPSKAKRARRKDRKVSKEDFKKIKRQIPYKF